MIAEVAHSKHESFYEWPYPHLKRTIQVGAGWWPGRHCQFLEFNCYTKVYREADRLLREVEEKEAEAAGVKPKHKSGGHH